VEAATAFCNSWRNRYFGACSVAADKDVTESDLHTKTLVLFGTSESNSIISRLSPLLPVKIEPARVVLSLRVYAAAGVSAQVVYPSPFNRSEYVVFMGESPVSVDLVQATLKGWYDYAVWDGKGRLVDVGRFDDTWKLPLSWLTGASGTR
jgi:hypothetical protein